MSLAVGRLFLLSSPHLVQDRLYCSRAKKGVPSDWGEGAVDWSLRLVFLPLQGTGLNPLSSPCPQGSHLPRCEAGPLGWV